MMGSPSEYHGIVERGRFGRWRVVIRGQGLGAFYVSIRFSAWSRDAAIRKAENWGLRQAHSGEVAEFTFDPESPEAGFEVKR